MRQSETAKIVALLMACYPKAKVGDHTPAAYETMLQDLDFAETMRAVRRIIATQDNPYALPTIATIRKAVTGAGMEHRTGDLAWGSVLKAVSTYGIYQTPKFEDSLTEVAVSQVGWKAICNSDTKSLGFLRHGFVKAYDAARDMIIAGGSVARLEGMKDHKALAGLHDEKTGQRGDLSLLVDVLPKVGG